MTGVQTCALPIYEKRVHIAIYGNMHASIAGGDFYLTPGIRRGEGGGNLQVPCGASRLVP